MNNSVPLLLNPFFVNIIGLFILRYGILKDNSKKSRLLFTSLAATSWILISSLRNMTIGDRDVYITYYSSFFQSIEKSWSDVIKTTVDGLTGAIEFKDPGFLIIEKTFSTLSNNYQVYLFLIALVFMCFFARFVYMNSRDVFISFLLYSVLFYQFFSMTGFRQTIATTLVTLVGYQFIKNKKFIPFLIITVISMSIHKSAITFFPFYFFANKKITKKWLSWSTIGILAAFSLRNSMMTLLSTMLGYDQYDNQFIGAGAKNFTLMLVVIFIVTIINYKKIVENNQYSTHYVNALILALLLTPLTYIDPNAMRAVQYYSLFLVLLVPEILYSIDTEYRYLIYYSTSFTFFLIFIRDIPRYLYFWS